MKKYFSSNAIYMASFAIASFLLTGCNDDDSYPDVDGQNPTISLTTDHIQTETGREFTIKGTVEDKDGIRSIRLANAELSLGKTIDLLEIYKEPVYTYDLSYSFKTPKTQEGESFNINITVTDLGGRTVESKVLVTMDGDFTAPTFPAAPGATVTVLIKEETKLNLRFSAADDKALDYVEVSIPELDFYEKLPVEGKALSYDKAISLPSAIASYNLEIKAVDKFSQETVKKSVITVSEMPDFSKMYLSDVKEADLLNSDLFGIPMLIERTAPYTYRARYYSEAPGTEVRFVPQKTDFSPICFGINPNDNTVLTDEPEMSLPIVLEEKGYYEITFNVLTGEYTTNRYTPTDEPAPYTVAIGSETVEFQMSLVGAGMVGIPGWDTRSGFVLTRDKDNPYLFYGEVELEAGSEVEFTITPKDLVHEGTDDGGWWLEPFWRFEAGESDSGENEYNTKNNGNNMSKVKVQKDGKYMFKFDTHLLRSRFYPIN